MKQFCIQQAYLDGWARCRATMMAKMNEMVAAGRIVEVEPNSIHNVDFAGANPTEKELNDYQDGGWKLPNAAIIDRWK
jgi:hypothetical protein